MHFYVFHRASEVLILCLSSRIKQQLLGLMPQTLSPRTAEQLITQAKIYSPGSRVAVFSSRSPWTSPLNQIYFRDFISLFSLHKYSF